MDALSKYFFLFVAVDIIFSKLYLIVEHIWSNLQFFVLKLFWAYLEALVLIINKLGCTSRVGRFFGAKIVTKKFQVGLLAWIQSY